MTGRVAGRVAGIITRSNGRSRQRLLPLCRDPGAIAIEVEEALDGIYGLCRAAFNTVYDAFCKILDMFDSTIEGLNPSLDAEHVEG